MNRSTLQDVLAKNRPFVLKTADGEDYSVPHRDYVSMPPSQAVVLVWGVERGYRILALNRVTGIRFRDS